MFQTQEEHIMMEFDCPLDKHPKGQLLLQWQQQERITKKQ